MGSIPFLGDIVTLADLATRVVCFINDLRHAQDDFQGLRGEADCLRMSVLPYACTANGRFNLI